MKVDSELLSVFVEEMDELISVSDKALTEKDPKELYRVYHILRGNAALLNLNQLTILAKACCSFLFPLRNNGSLDDTSILEECHNKLIQFRQSTDLGLDDSHINVRHIVAKLKKSSRELSEMSH